MGRISAGGGGEEEGTFWVGQKEVGKHGGRPRECGPVLVYWEMGTWCSGWDCTILSVIRVNSIHCGDGFVESKTSSILESLG